MQRMNLQDQSQLLNSQQGVGQNFEFQDENKPRDFSSVEKLVNMPDLRKVKPYENVFPPVQDQLKNSEEISPQLKETMIELRDKLRNEFNTFEDSRKFKFTFPDSKFPPVQPGTRNLITYEQKNIVEEEDTFRDKLSPQQIEQIAKNGEFKVRSNLEYITLPYVWKVNETLFKGKRNIELAWQKNIAKAHSLIYVAKETLKRQVPIEIQKIKKLPIRLFSLFFGKKSMKTTYSIDYEKQIGKDFWNEVMSKHYEKSKEWGSELWEYLDTHYKAEDWMFMRVSRHQNDGDDDDDVEMEEPTKEYDRKVKQQLQSRKKYQQRVELSNAKKQKIAKVGDEFQRRWAKSKKKVFQQVSLQHQKQNSKEDNTPSYNESEEFIRTKEKQNEQQILQRFNKRKFQNYTSYLQTRLPKLDIPSGVIEAIITMLTLMQIMSRKQRKFDSKLKDQKQKVQNKIKNQNKILQYDWNWYSNEVTRLYTPIEERVREEYTNKFIDTELIKRLNMKQKEVYNLWMEYRIKYPAFLQAKRKQLPEIQQPSRIFYSTYQLFPPFKIIKHTQNKYTWYDMIKQGKMQISTDKNFWKLDLYVMRVKSWTINCVMFLIYNCWQGHLGLRCLWGMREFAYDENVDYYKGQRIHNVRKPVLLVFKTVLQGIQKSRQHFEGLPDRGLFGKNFSRLFNYIECYLFRFLFVGVIITLIIYPIAIILTSVLTFLLVLTVWVWMPLILLVTYLFNTLLFQFESSFIPYGFFIRAAPLPSLILSLLGSLGRILMLAFWVSVLAPIGAFFVCLWTGFIRGFRTATDLVMLIMIRNLGRTPSRNTAIAKKISGPGMSKEYYMSINEQDVYILIQSELQQIFMQQYHRIFNQKVSKPVDRLTTVMKLLLAPLQSNNNASAYNNYYYPQQQNVITQSVNDLKNHFSIEYNNYMNRYPTRPYNIRFTQEQLDSYFENTVMIVKNFVSKMEISSWVFEDFHILEDYEELTRRIWMRVFSCGQEIFQPLEKIDQRFKLEDMYKSDHADEYASSFTGASMKSNVHKVMQALQGQIELKPRRANISNFKHSLINKELQAVGIREVFALRDNNANGNVYFDKNNPKFLFYVNLAIKEIIKRDAHDYEVQREQSYSVKNQRR